VLSGCNMVKMVFSLPLSYVRGCPGPCNTLVMCFVFWRLMRVAYLVKQVCNCMMVLTVFCGEPCVRSSMNNFVGYVMWCASTVTGYEPMPAQCSAPDTGTSGQWNIQICTSHMKIIQPPSPQKTKTKNTVGESKHRSLLLYDSFWRFLGHSEWGAGGVKCIRSRQRNNKIYGFTTEQSRLEMGFHTLAAILYLFSLHKYLITSTP
jgi:hypothetical protein